MRASKPAPVITEALTVDLADVDRAPAAVRGDGHGLLQVLGDAEVGGQQVGRARGDDGHGDRGVA
jgi:hypothetical protein